MGSLDLLIYIHLQYHTFFWLRHKTTISTHMSHPHPRHPMFQDAFKKHRLADRPANQMSSFTYRITGFGNITCNKPKGPSPSLERKWPQNEHETLLMRNIVYPQGKSSHIPHFERENHRLKSTFRRNMLVPRTVNRHIS